MQLPRPNLRVVARRDTEQHISACTPVAARSSHTAGVLLIVVGALAVIAAGAYVLWAINLVAQGGPSGLGVPPDADGGVPCGRFVHLAKHDVYVECQPEDRMPLVGTSEGPHSEAP